MILWLYISLGLFNTLLKKTDRVLDLFYKERGKQFDPVLVDQFFLHQDEFLAIRERYRD